MFSERNVLCAMQLQIGSLDRNSDIYSDSIVGGAQRRVRVLVTGGTGLVGSNVIEAARKSLWTSWPALRPCADTVTLGQ